MISSGVLMLAHSNRGMISGGGGEVNGPALRASFSCPLSFFRVASLPSPQMPYRPWRSAMAFELVLATARDPRKKRPRRLRHA